MVLVRLSACGCLQISQLNALVSQILDVAKATIEAANVLMATQDSTSSACTQANMEVSHCCRLYMGV